jgi:hypothetical protein
MTIEAFEKLRKMKRADEFIGCLMELVLRRGREGIRI